MATSLSGRTWVSVLVLGLVGVSLIVAGAAELTMGNVHYRNYWGGQVFAPFTIVVGVVLLFVVPFGWRREERAPKLRGKAARRARRAEATRFPIDDFDKPWNP